MRETKSVQDNITEPKPSTSSSEERYKNDNSQEFDTASKSFDDFCFKAPLPPVKKTALNSSKKRSINGAKLNGRPKLEEDGSTNEKASEKVVSTSMEQLRLDSEATTTGAAAFTSEVCVSIGKDSFLCPRSRQYFASEFPGLTLKKPSPTTIETLDNDDKIAAKKETKNNVDTLLEEVIIDGFSLLLFTSSDDHDVLKEHERQLKEQEQEEDNKRRLHESSTRSASKSKKGRKHKVDAEKAIRKEKREMKEKEREERREARRMRKQQKEQLARDRQERKDRLQQLTAEERLAEKRREKREKRESVAASNVNNGASTSTDVYGDVTADVVVELNSVTITPKSNKSREELRRIKREKKLQQVKQQLKQAAACASDENSANNSILTSNQQSTFLHHFSAGLAQSTSAGVSTSDSGNEHCSTVQNMAAAELSKDDSSIKTRSGDNAGNPLTPTDMGCVSTATTSTAFNESSEALKRPSSAIGIAQQQRSRTILSPLDNGMNGRNGIVPSHVDLPPANKVRKLETGINDFLNAHQHLSGMAGARLPPMQNNNLLLKSEIKMENGFIPKSNTSTILNNSTANSQRSTPLSKGTPLSADPAHGNSASSSTGPQLPIAIQTPSTSSGSTTLLSQASKQLPMLGGVDASMLAVLQQLLGGSVPGGASSVADDSARMTAANLLYQQNLLSHADWLSANQQKLSLKAPTMNSLESPANLMAAAVSLGSGFPLLNYQQQLLQHQIEQAQKRPVSTTQQCTTADTMSQQTFSSLTKFGGGALAFVPSSSMLPTAFPAHLLAGGETLSAANTAILGKVPLSQMQNSATKNNKWTERHVMLANKISRDADHRRNLVAATQQLPNSQQLTHQQQLLQQQKMLQQQQQLSMTAFMPGNSKQSGTEVATSAVATADSLATSRKRSEAGENAAPQYKRPNITPTVGLTRQQQEQHRQQVIQMAALKKQQAQQQHPQALQQQQQLQMEALRRMQQQQQFQKQTNPQLSINQPNENFLSQLHLLQQQQRLQATSTTTSSSNASAQPTAIAKAMAFQQATPQQMTSHQAQPGAPSLHNGLSATASQLLSPASFMNSALFDSGAPKLIGSSNAITNEQQRQQSQAQPQQKLITSQPQQQRVLPLQPLGASLAYATAQASSAASNSLLPSVSVADALSLPQHLNLQNHLHSHHQLQQQQQSQQHQQLQQHLPITTSLGFPIAPQGVAPSGISGGSLTSGTSAQAAALAASVGDPTAQLNSLLALQQQQTAASVLQGAALNNPMMAMAQLMMQQLSNSTPASSASNIQGSSGGLNPLLSLQSQQQLTTNNILASLGIMPNSGIPSSMPSSSQPNQISQMTGASPQQPQHMQHSGQRMPHGVQSSIHFVGSGTNTAPSSSSTVASTAVPLTVSSTTTTSSSSASASSANAALQQQQQDLLLQAALLHGIQSLETKQPSIAGTTDAPPPAALLQHHHVAAVGAAHSTSCNAGHQPQAGGGGSSSGSSGVGGAITTASQRERGVPPAPATHFLLAEQFQQQQQQQLLLERIAGLAGANPRGLC